MTWEQVLNGIASIGQAIQATFACLTFFLTLGAVLFGLRELAEMEKSRRFDVATRLADWIFNPAASSDREFVLYELPADPEQASQEQRERAHKVWASLQQVAFYVTEGLIPEQIIMRGSSELYVKCWHKLKPYIQDERLHRGEHPGKPYYARDFEQLAKRCAEYYRREFPQHTLPSI